LHIYFVEKEDIADKVYKVDEFLYIDVKEALELVRSLKVSDDTHARLSKHGKYGESMDKIIAKILDFYEGKNKK
jgi:hypothetical protein